MSSTALAPFASERGDRVSDRLAAAEGDLCELLAGSAAAGYPPGATLLVVDAEGPLLRLFGGWSCVVGERIPTERETIYDLASLTKVVATVTLALALAERDLWDLDDPVAAQLAGFPREDITVRQLLTHTSGLVPHREFYRLAHGASKIAPLVYAEALAATAGAVDYSDLNYMVLGWALEACARRPLDDLFASEVGGPLGMVSTGFRPPAELRRRVAATELDGDQRLAPGLVWGEVHDGNAWALGGVSGHAGLFSTADDLGRFASALLAPERHPVLAQASLAELVRRQAGTPPDVRALGWRLDASEWGPWPEGTYWHTGFTGTSLLVAPGAGVAIVFLTGGVHPVRQLEEQGALRTRVHRLLAEAVR